MGFNYFAKLRDEKKCVVFRIGKRATLTKQFGLVKNDTKKLVEIPSVFLFAYVSHTSFFSTFPTLSVAVRLFRSRSNFLAIFRKNYRATEKLIPVVNNIVPHVFYSRRRYSRSEIKSIPTGKEIRNTIFPKLHSKKPPIYFHFEKSD